MITIFWPLNDYLAWNISSGQAPFLLQVSQDLKNCQTNLLWGHEIPD
jgi:hypothetical protein